MKVTDEEIVRIVGRRYRILKELYPDEEYNLTDLAETTGMDKGNLSKYIHKLEKDWKLVKTREGESERGRPFKYIRLTESAKRIVASMIDATQPKPEAKLEEWQINELLDILEDSNLSEDLRLSYADTFHKLCRDYLDDVIKSERSQRLLERVVTSPSPDKVGEKLRSSLSVVWGNLVKDKKWSSWTLTLYPTFIKHMSDKETNENIRKWSMQRIGEVARLSLEPSIKEPAKKKLLEICFSNDMDLDSELGKEVKQQIVWLGRYAFKDVKLRAKDENPKAKAKAESLLKELRECLLPREENAIVAN